MSAKVMEALSFYLEDRGGVMVRVDKSGGCGPATEAEVELWNALEAADKVRSEEVTEVAPGVRLPVWLIESASRISRYMTMYYPGDWVLDGIQNRRTHQIDGDVICPNCERATDIRHCQACGCDFIPGKQPVRPPIGRGIGEHALAGEIVAAVVSDEQNGGCDLSAGLFGPAMSALIRKIATEYLAPLQPAVDLEQFREAVVFARQYAGFGERQLRYDRLLALIDAQKEARNG